MPNTFAFDINGAMQAGYTPDQIAQYLASQQKQGSNFQLTPTPQTTPQQSQQPMQPKNQWADWLPTAGSVVGGIAGAAIPILGETGLGEIGGSATGGALGEGLRELIQGKPISGGDIATQGVIGGVGGAVGKGVGYVAGKVLPKIGGAAPMLEGIATDIKQGTRQIRVKPSIYGAAQENAINATLDKYGASGTAQQQYQQLPSIMQTIEGKINKVIADNPQAGANRQDIQDTFTKNLQSNIRTGDLTNNQAKNETNNYLNDLLKASGVETPGKDDFIPLGQLRILKKLVNNDYENISTKLQNGQTLTPKQKVINEAWDSLDQAVKNASPEVKGLLTEESHIYKAPRSLSAARSNPPTLRLAGTSIPANVTQTARDLGAGALNLANKGLSAAPGGLSPVLSQGAGQAAARALLPATPQQAYANTQSGQNNPQDNGQTNVTQNNSSGNFNQNSLPPSPVQASGNYNSSINQNQAVPPSPNSFFQAQMPKDFMKGWTLNGGPVDPATANLIWQVTNYRLDPTKMTSLRNDQREKLISLASRVDPSYTSSQYPVVESTRKDFTTGKSAQTIRSLNTAIGHLNALSSAGQQLGNGQFPLLNSVGNAVKQGTGQPGVNRFNTAANAVAGEMATVFKNSGATDQEISAWRSQLDPNMSPEQLKVAITQMISLMGSRLGALQSQYEANIGKPADFSFISPESQQVLQNLGIDPNSMTQQ